MNYFAIPGFKKVKHIPAQTAGSKVKEAFISIDMKRAHVSFYTNAKKLLDVNVGDKLGFTQIDELLFIHKCDTGNTVCNKFDGGFRITHHGFKDYLKKHFGVNKTIKCELEATKSRFNDAPMFRLILPKYYASLYKQVKTKIT